MIPNWEVRQTTEEQTHTLITGTQAHRAGAEHSLLGIQIPEKILPRKPEPHRCQRKVREEPAAAFGGCHGELSKMIQRDPPPHPTPRSTGKVGQRENARV